MSDDKELADARDRLAALRNGFSKRLHERIADLEIAVDAAGMGQSGAVRRVEAFAHKLAGTAGSYGYHGVGEVAAELEALCSETFDADRARALVGKMLRAAKR